MPSPFVANVRSAARSVWPEVQASLAQLYQGSTRKPGRRDVCDQTAWALARHGLLRTQSEAALIEAVTTYFEEYEADPDCDEEMAVFEILQRVKAEQEALV